LRWLVIFLYNNDLREMGGDGGYRFKYGAGATINRGVFTVGARIGTRDPGKLTHGYNHYFVF